MADVPVVTAVEPTASPPEYQPAATSGGAAFGARRTGGGRHRHLSRRPSGLDAVYLGHNQHIDRGHGHPSRVRRAGELPRRTQRRAVLAVSAYDAGVCDRLGDHRSGDSRLHTGVDLPQLAQLGAPRPRTAHRLRLDHPRHRRCPSVACLPGRGGHAQPVAAVQPALADRRDAVDRRRQHVARYRVLDAAVRRRPQLAAAVVSGDGATRRRLDAAATHRSRAAIDQGLHPDQPAADQPVDVQRLRAVPADRRRARPARGAARVPLREAFGPRLVRLRRRSPPSSWRSISSSPASTCAPDGGEREREEFRLA